MRQCLRLRGRPEASDISSTTDRGVTRGAIFLSPTIRSAAPVRATGAARRRSPAACAARRRPDRSAGARLRVRADRASPSAGVSMRSSASWISTVSIARMLDRAPATRRSSRASSPRRWCRSATDRPASAPRRQNNLRRKRERARLLGEHVRHRFANPPHRVGDELDVSSTDRTAARPASARGCLHGSDRGTTRRARR